MLSHCWTSLPTSSESRTTCLTFGRNSANTKSSSSESSTTPPSSTATSQNMGFPSALRLNHMSKTSSPISFWYRPCSELSGLVAWSLKIIRMCLSLLNHCLLKLLDLRVILRVRLHQKWKNSQPTTLTLLLNQETFGSSKTNLKKINKSIFKFWEKTKINLTLKSVMTY